MDSKKVHMTHDDDGKVESLKTKAISYMHVGEGEIDKHQHSFLLHTASPGYQAITIHFFSWKVLGMIDKFRANGSLEEICSQEKTEPMLKRHIFNIYDFLGRKRVSLQDVTLRDKKGQE